MQKRKKLLYLCNRIFWPALGGHEVKVFHYCRGLHERFGYEIDIYVFDDAAKAENREKPSFLRKVYCAERIGFMTKACNILCKSFLSAEKWPIQNSLYHSRKNASAIRSLIAQEDYDVVIVDMARLASYFTEMETFRCKKILDMDDTLSKRYTRQLKALTSKTVIAGQYHEKLPVFLQKLLQLSLVKKAVLRAEIPRMERMEKNAADLFDRIFFVSPIETDAYNQKYGTDKAVAVGLGVDYPHFAEALPVQKCAGKAVFVGNMATPANADSVRFMIDEVLPHARWLQRVFIIGKCPAALRNEYRKNPRVVFTGNVTDHRVGVQEGMVFLAPITYGTGIKTKILEAMAMGMPVVTTSIGAEGIHGVHGKHWFVSDDPAGMAKHVDELLLSPEKCHEVGENARQFVKANFQWNIIFDRFAELGL